MLKNFRRVDVLRKYFNTKILQHSVCNSVIGFHTARVRKERQARARTERVTVMEESFERNCCIRGYHVAVSDGALPSVWYTVYQP